MIFNKKSTLCFIFAVLINIPPLNANDWLDKLSAAPLFYPMLVQSAFFIGYLCRGLSDSWESSNRKKELETIIETKIKNETAGLKTKIDTIETRTNNINTILTKIDTLDVKIDEISTNMTPILAQINTSSTILPETIKNLTAAIRTLNNEALPELETRLKDEMELKMKAIKAAIDSNNSLEQVSVLNSEFKNLTKKLDKKLSTLLLCNNTFVTEIKDDIRSTKTDVKNALEQIENLKKERNNSSIIPPVVLYGTTKLDTPFSNTPFPGIKLKSNDTNQN